MLPSFEVKLSPEKQFFHVEDKEFTININAMYVTVFVLMDLESDLFSRDIVGEGEVCCSEVLLGHFTKELTSIYKLHVYKVFPEVLQGLNILFTNIQWKTK